MATRKDRFRLVVALSATLAVLGPLGYLWWSSLMPGTFSVMDMGYVDYGGGPRESMAGMHHNGTSVADLVADPRRKADVVVDLVARRETFKLASGRSYDGYTINRQSPGPLITAVVGQLVEVHLRNDNVPAGITLHWHGVDVPNAEDGVAGVTQNAVGQGQEHVYRFVADKPGSYWYHSHQVSHEQVIRGLLGPVVVLPKGGLGEVVDLPAVAHTYGGVGTLNGREGNTKVAAEPGSIVRIRVINTDNGPLQVWANTPYRLRAVDGWDLVQPTEVEEKEVDVAAGARADIEVVVPDSGTARVQVGAETSLSIGPDEAGTEVPEPKNRLDLLSYGASMPLPFDPATADRHFRYAVGRKPGFVDGKPGFWWSINGHLFPDVPMFYVEEGDLVVFHIENSSGDAHPMHLHGHHAIVLKRNGKPSTGSPWWVDSLNVRDGESYDIAFLADNPGIWMDHCHNLKHAAQGLVAHLMYAGVTEPYRVGGDSENEPE